MKLTWIFPSLITAALLCTNGPSAASQLSVEPILLEMNAPTAAGILKLHSDEGSDVEVQTRVERWTEVDGIEKLEPTNDVVSSPPAMRMAPSSDYIVRIVRVSKVPVRGEESYRVLVDQLPGDPRRPGQAINLLIRQSIPVFFRAAQVTPANVAWLLVRKGPALSISATNSGDERLRIASLRLTDAAGRTVSFGNGLVGYVLGHSSVNWQLPPHPRDFALRGAVAVAAQTNKGTLQTVAK